MQVDAYNLGGNSRFAYEKTLAVTFPVDQGVVVLQVSRERLRIATFQRIKPAPALRVNGEQVFAVRRDQRSVRPLRSDGACFPVFKVHPISALGMVRLGC